MNTLTKLSVMTCMSLSLIGCGGGGGGGSSSSGSASSSSTSVSLEDLRIDNQNGLESVYHVAIDVLLPELAAEQAYISVCDNSNGVDQINYDNCLIKAALHQGAGQYQLRVANHCQDLVAVVSVMKPDEPTRYYQHTHDDQLETTWLIQ